MTLVVLSPHLDDAVLSAYLTLTRIPETVVVNVYDGIPPASAELSTWDRICGGSDPVSANQARLDEDAAVLLGLGVRRLSVGLLQSSYRAGAGDFEDATSALLETFADLGRPAVVAPMAAGPKPHPDHRLVRDAARAALRVDAIGSLDYYADFPYSVKAGAWPTVWGGTADVRWTGRLLRELELGGWLGDWARYELDAAERAAKLEAMQGYRTQFTALDRRLRTKGLVSNPELYGVEVVVSRPRPPADR